MSSSDVKNSASNQNEDLQKLFQTFIDIDSLIAPTDSTLSVEGKIYLYLGTDQSHDILEINMLSRFLLQGFTN